MKRDEPVLFLDFDGVLNSHRWLRISLAERQKRSNHYLIDPVAVALLDRVVLASRCWVVFSSTWRLQYDLDDLRELLRRCGMSSADRIIGTTPDNSALSDGFIYTAEGRGKEINRWREENNHVGVFAILDDDGDMEPVQDALIQTSFDDGLLEKHVDPLLYQLQYVRYIEPVIIQH